jgi:GT2 family glycosyltransferase
VLAPRPSVVSVVLTYNNSEDTSECLDSLLAQTYHDHRVLVVDNGSTDDSPSRLQERWAGAVEFVASQENLGCGGGYALGIGRALAAGADYVGIMDNDIVADPDLVAALLAPFARGPGVGLTAPVMTYFDEPDRVWFAGGVYHRLLGLTRHAGLGRSLSDLRDALGKVWATDYAPSCAVLISRHALEAVGLPDARFFFGHDDVDWCLRARQQGYLRLVVGQALVRHKVSTTGGERGSTAFTSFSAYHHAAGSMLMGAKHARGAGLAPYLFGQLCVRWPYYSLQMLRAGRLDGPTAYLRGLLAGSRYLWRPNE